MNKQIISVIALLLVAPSICAKNEQTAIVTVQEAHAKKEKKGKKETFGQFFYDGTSYSMITEKGDYIPEYYED